MADLLASNWGLREVELKYDDELSYRKKIIVSLAGPLFSILFFLIAVALFFLNNGATIYQEGQTIVSQVFGRQLFHQLIYLQR